MTRPGHLFRISHCQIARGFTESECGNLGSEQSGMTYTKPINGTDDLSGVREALAARVDTCWDRLEDAVSELVALHGHSDEEIVERVRVTCAAELTSD